MHQVDEDRGENDDDAKNDDGDDNVGVAVVDGAPHLVRQVFSHDYLEGTECIQVLKHHHPVANPFLPGAVGVEVGSPQLAVSFHLIEDCGVLFPRGHVTGAGVNCQRISTRKN